MNHRRVRHVVTLGAALVLLTGCGTVVTPINVASNNSTLNSTTPADDTVVHVSARNFDWTVGKANFSVGKTIQFDVTSTQGTHGFSIDGTSVSRVIPQGKNVLVTWTPQKPGKYTIRCNIFCGSGHNNMFTTITVT